MDEKKISSIISKERYYNERHINLKEIFNKEELQVLKKLGNYILIMNMNVLKLIFLHIVMIKTC